MIAARTAPETEPIPPSTTNSFSNSATRFCIAPFEAPDNFEYTKNTYGLDLNYRIDARQKILAQYNYVQVDRQLEPADESTLHRAWIEYRNTKWANWSGRLRYQYQQQRSELNHTVTNNSSGQTSANVPYYFTAYDVNNFDQNMVRLNVDWTPLPLFMIGFGATWRDTSFKENYYGRTDDKTQLYDVTVSYGDPDKFRIMAIGNYGDVTFDQMYRNTGANANVTPPIPNLGPLPGGGSNSLNFNWGTANSQENWLVALLADWVPMENLRLTTSYSYAKTDGGVDFWSDNQQAAGGFIHLINSGSASLDGTALAARAPFVTASPLIRTALSSLPDRMTLTLVTVAGTRWAFFRHSMSITASLGIASSCNRSSAVAAAMCDTNPHFGSRRCSGIWPPSKPTLWYPPARAR